MGINERIEMRKSIRRNGKEGRKKKRGRTDNDNVFN